MVVSYQAYNNLASPNEVLVKIAEYVTSRGYSAVKNAVEEGKINKQRYDFYIRTLKEILKIKKF